MGAKTRRLENNLVTLGTGIIAFGLWAFIKLILTVLFLGSAYFEDSPEEQRLAVIIATWVVAVLTLLMYVWLGLSARAEGKGKRKKPVYLFVVGMIIVYGFIMILIEVFLMITKFNEIEDPLSLFITIIIDVTRMIFLFELIYSSVTLRKIRKQAREGVSA
ncbi:hypothetical protein [Ruminococcus sp.]|uniref:hypothetical protein n=1 Tax=Ruminococcus sp. TaxID=41978 RepID=UPI003869E832